MNTLQTIKEMNFNTRYTNAEILAFHDAVLKCANTATAPVLSCTDAMLASYAATVEQLQQLVHHDSKSQFTAKITDEDNKRDAAITTLFALLDTYASSPLAAMQSAGNYLKELTRLYRHTASSALATETVEVKNLLELLAAPAQQPYISQIAHLDELITEIERANNEVDRLMIARSAEEVSKAYNSERRTAAATAYQAIVLRANASVVLLPSEGVSTFVTEVNNTITRTVEVYNQRIGRLHAKKEA